MDQEKRAKESGEERSRGRSSQRRKEQEQPEEAEKKRCKSASTWTPPRRNSVSPVRCISPHNCRDSATGGCRHKLLDSTRRSRSTTPEARESSSASREIQDRYTRMMNLERERMREVWCRMEKEQKALLDTRDGMTKLMAKGTTELWRLKQRMDCLLKGFKNKICKACGEENKSREKREEAAKNRARSEEAARRRPLSNREDPTSPDSERAGRRPSKEAMPAAAGCAGSWAPGCPTRARRTLISSTASASGSSTAPAVTGEKGRRPMVMTSRDGVSLSATVPVSASSQ